MCKRTRSSDASAATVTDIARGATAGRRDDATTRAPVTAVEALRDIYDEERKHALVSQSINHRASNNHTTITRFHALARPHRPRARRVRPHHRDRRQETLGHGRDPFSPSWRHSSRRRGTRERTRATNDKIIFFGRASRSRIAYRVGRERHHRRIRRIDNDAAVRETTSRRGVRGSFSGVSSSS